MTHLLSDLCHMEWKNNKYCHQHVKECWMEKKVLVVIDDMCEKNA
jgi:hypothetical protein